MVRQVVARGDPLELFFFRQVDNHYTIDQVGLVGLQQQRYHDDAVGRPDFRDQLLHALAYLRVQDGFKLLFAGGIGENPLAQPGTVQGPV